MLEEYFTNKIISLHFRIGDLKNNKGHGPVLNTQYYRNALKIILEKDNTCDTILYFNEEQDNNTVENIIKDIKKSYLLIKKLPNQIKIL